MEFRQNSLKESLLVYDVAKYILDESDTIKVASRFISDSEDPFWANAAREVLVSIFKKLYRENGTDWSWWDVNKYIGDNVKLVDVIAEHNESLAEVFKDPRLNTSKHILYILENFVFTIKDLTIRSLIYAKQPQNAALKVGDVRLLFKS